MIVEVDGQEIEFPDSMTADEIKAVLRRKFPPKEAAPTLTDRARAGLQGMTLGTSDEIGSALAAIPAAITTGTSPLAAYRDMQSRVSQEQKQYAQQNPGEAMALELAGGLLTGGATGVKALPGLLAKMSKPAAAGLLGGVQGGIYGAATAEQGERMEGAAKGAAIGAVAAPVAGAALEVAGDAVGGLAKWAAAKLADTPKAQAERTLRQVAEQAGLSADDVVAAWKRLGPEAVLADADESLRFLARGAADNLGSFKGQARGLLETRQLGSTGRLADAAQTGLNSNADDFVSMIQRVKAERAAKADPLYAQARQEGDAELAAIRDAYRANNPDSGEWGWLSAALGDRPSLVKAVKSGIRAAKDEGKDPGDNLLSIMDAAKQQLDARIESHMVRGEAKSARPLLALKNDLLELLDSVSPAYKSARDTYAGDSALLSAAQKGTDFLKTSTDDMRALVAGMSQSEKEMYRHGAVKAIVGKLEDTDLTHDAARKLISKKSLLDRLGLVFDDPAEAETFIRKAIAEREFARTRQVVTGGSMTSANLKAGEGLQNAMQPETVLAFLSGQPASAALAAVREIVGAKKVSPEMLGHLGRLLMTKGIPEAEVRRALTTPPMAQFSGLLGQTYPAAARGAVAPAAVGLLQ